MMSCDKGRVHRARNIAEFLTAVRHLYTSIENASLSGYSVMIGGKGLNDPSKVKDEFLCIILLLWELEAPISRDEIRRLFGIVVKIKSPGRTVLPLILSQILDIVGYLIFAYLWMVLHSAPFPVGCNSSFIALIPKTLNPKSVGEYRPISLIGSIYKIVTKILANRLSTVLRLTLRLYPHLSMHDQFSSREWSRGISTGLSWTLYRRKLESSIRAVGTIPFILKMRSIFMKPKNAFYWREKMLWFAGLREKLLSFQSVVRIKLVYALNRGLLFKWIWRFLSRDQSLWAQVIHALHGSNTSTLSASYSSLWSSIIKECNALKSQGLDLISHCKIRVGNGMSTSFWHDQWLGDSCLRLSYPRLFALENNKVCSVAAKMSAPFVSSLRRDVRGGEESAQLSRISDLLDTVVLSNMGDRRFWDLNGDGCFRVKDVRRLLDDMLLPKSDVPSRWVKQIPIKVNVLAWKISMDRLPTRVNLHRRGVQVSPISCPICCEALENLDHLLFCCDLAKDIARFNQVQNKCWKECFTLPGGVSGHIETISSSLIQIFEKMVFLKT
ncbi:RNA-directed DNA polymerase, eukaryota [Tanacetum coccineum]